MTVKAFLQQFAEKKRIGMDYISPEAEGILLLGEELYILTKSEFQALEQVLSIMRHDEI